MTTQAETELARITGLAGQAKSLIEPFHAANMDKAEAVDTAKKAGDTEVSQRETVMGALAAFSVSQSLSVSDIKAVSKKVVSAFNDKATQRTIETFMGECKHAMHPKVRARFVTITRLRDQCWDSEVDLTKVDSDAATPMKNAFKRKYHMLTSLCGAVEDDLQVVTPEDVLQHAERIIAERRADCEKAHKRVAKVIAEIQAIYQDYPLDDLTSAIQSLQDVTVDALKGALTVSVPEAQKAQAPAEETTTVVEDETEDSVAEGAVDIDLTDPDQLAA